ncbi:hypothetical protein LJB90_02895 [Eubacteriales bacterium OttesenSCG-928-G02]|nr:hypothetical protein [Eubacteriales bacterium OttesenSCG-928-G02]
MKKIISILLAVLLVTGLTLAISAARTADEQQWFEDGNLVDGQVLNIQGVDSITTPGGTVYTTEASLLNETTGVKSGVVIVLEKVKDQDYYKIVLDPSVPVWNADLGKVERPVPLALAEGQIAIGIEAPAMTPSAAAEKNDDGTPKHANAYQKLAARLVAKDMYVVLDGLDLSKAATELEGTATIYFDEPKAEESSAAPVESSTAPVESKDESSKSSDTSDAGIAAGVVIAIVALAGGALIASRKRS